MTSQIRKLVFGLLAFVDSVTPYSPSHEQYEEELALSISQDEAQIGVLVVVEADVVTAGAVADAVMVVPLVMTGSRLNQDATDAAVDATASSEPSSIVSGIASASTGPGEKLTNAAGSQSLIVIRGAKSGTGCRCPVWTGIVTKPRDRSCGSCAARFRS